MTTEIVDDDPNLFRSRAWLESQKQRWELTTVMHLIRVIKPQIDDLFERVDGVDMDKILLFLRNTTLVGLIPKPHAILCRSIEHQKFMDVVFSTFVWGLIYIRNQETPL